MFTRHLTPSLAIAAALLLGASPALAVPFNVARVGTASQSSTRVGTATQGDIAQVALDNNTSGVFNDGSVTHTDTQDNPFWEVNLHADRTIDQIVVWNRTDAVSDRLDGFVLSILDANRNTVATFNPATPLPDESIDIGGVTGQFVRIDLPGSGRPLSLAEVQVFADIAENDPLIFGQGRNLARLGVASQTSTRTGAPQGNKAILAIDGNTSGVFGNGSVTHSLDELSPSWMVDLGESRAIDNIVLHERTDSCCVNRLADGVVRILDAGMAEVASFPFADVTNSGNRLYIPADFGTMGQFIQVQLNDNGAARTLELAEVQVFGGETFNIARDPGATAFQSSTRVGSGGNEARFAIDGITDGIFANGSVTHTLTEDNPFWQLDLASTSLIETIILHNRTDTCCQDRLAGFELDVLDRDGNAIFNFTGPPMTGADPIRIDLPLGLIGDSIRIALPGSDRTMSLAEVQVFGQAIPEPATAALALLGLGALITRTRRRRLPTAPCKARLPLHHGA